MVERYLSGAIFADVEGEIKPIGVTRYLIGDKGLINVSGVGVVSSAYYSAYRWSIVTYDSGRFISNEPIRLDYESYMDLLVDCL